MTDNNKTMSTDADRYQRLRVLGVPKTTDESEMLRFTNLDAYRQIRTAPPLADRHGEPEEGRPAWLAYVVAFRRSEMRIPIFNHRISYHRRDRHRYRWTPCARWSRACPADLNRNINTNINTDSRHHIKECTMGTDIHLFIERRRTSP